MWMNYTLSFFLAGMFPHAWLRVNMVVGRLDFLAHSFDNYGFMVQYGNIVFFFLSEPTMQSKCVYESV